MNCFYVKVRHPPHLHPNSLVSTEEKKEAWLFCVCSVTKATEQQVLQVWAACLHGQCFSTLEVDLMVL